MSIKIKLKRKKKPREFLLSFFPNPYPFFFLLSAQTFPKQGCGGTPPPNPLLPPHPSGAVRNFCSKWVRAIFRISHHFAPAGAGARWWRRGELILPPRQNPGFRKSKDFCFFFPVQFPSLSELTQNQSRHEGGIDFGHGDEGN